MQENIEQIQEAIDGVNTLPVSTWTNNVSDALTGLESVSDQGILDLLYQIYSLLEQLRLLTN